MCAMRIYLAKTLKNTALDKTTMIGTIFYYNIIEKFET